MTERCSWGDIAPYVIAVVGVVLVGLFTYVWVEDRERERYEALRVHGYDVDAEQRIEGVCINLSGAEQTSCIRETIQTTNEHQRAERDLSAQNRMALWAGLMFWASAASTAVAAGGIYFIWKTLETNAAAVAQAREANRIASDMAHWERRPWISMDVEAGPSRAIYRVPDKDVITPITIRIKNHGRSPAEYWVAPVTFKTLDEADQQSVINKMREEFHGYPFKGIIFPDQTPAPDRPQVENKQGTFHYFKIPPYPQMTFDSIINGNIACIILYRAFDSNEISETVRYFSWTIRTTSDFFSGTGKQEQLLLYETLGQRAT